MVSKMQYPPFCQFCQYREPDSLGDRQASRSSRYRVSSQTARGRSGADTATQQRLWDIPNEMGHPYTDAFPPSGADGREIVLGELFCGAGGLALGAHNAVSSDYYYTHAWVTDVNPDACKTIKQVVKDRNRIICKDVQDLEIGSLERIDGLVFGFPCNDFSVVGERKGTKGVHGPLYTYGVSVLNKLNPLFFVAENVSGLASTNGSRDFEKILDALKSAGDDGYNVETELYRFEQWGVPQRRHRYIIVGFAKKSNIAFKHPIPDPDRQEMTAETALQGIAAGTPNHAIVSPSADVQARLSYIKPGENAFTARDIPERLRLRMRSGALISQIYRRLKADEPAYTVTASGGGGTHLYHWNEDRALTNRERARLQTFPDDYEFYGRKESVRKQIGMAVPPKGAEVIFKAVGSAVAEYRKSLY